MFKNSILFLLFVFSTIVVHASETGIAKSNFKDWQGISLWCETDAPTVDQSAYICSIFYGEFSQQAKAEGIPFVYVQTEGTHTAEWLYENNWFPVSVEMVQIAHETTKAKVIVGFLETQTSVCTKMSSS